MKNRTRGIVVTAAAGVLAAAMAGTAPAQAQLSHEGHGGGHPGMGHGAPAGVAAAAGPGVLVRESKIEGSAFVYRLYSWAERNVMMKGMEGHAMAGMDNSGKSTHHLMLFVTGPDGKELAGGKVGFVVVAPDKSEFKTLTMAMSGGYGADLPLQAKGDHTIRTKAVFGNRTLTEEFTLSVK